jgi:hypothetical protein
MAKLLSIIGLKTLVNSDQQQRETGGGKNRISGSVLSGLPRLKRFGLAKMWQKSFPSIKCTKSRFPDQARTPPEPRRLGEIPENSFPAAGSAPGAVPFPATLTHWPAASRTASPQDGISSGENRRKASLPRPARRAARHGRDCGKLSSWRESHL